MMLNRLCLFVFEFRNEDDTERIGVIDLGVWDLTIVEPKLDYIQAQAGPIENKYGVHDCSGTWDDRTYVLGFHTYEIQGAEQDACMAEWLDVFRTHWVARLRSLKVEWMTAQEFETKYGLKP